MRKVSLLLPLALLLSACGPSSSSSITSEGSLPPLDDPFETEVTERRLSKEDYFNKTLGGLLGQFAGFLSGYEFVWNGPNPYVPMPLEWFDFLNGPYAGNYEHYWPGDYASGANIYDRLKVNPDTGLYEVWSDDDYHLDIFNQTVMKEFGTSSYAVKEAWKKYQISDWGGGGDAMSLIASNEMLSPYTGTIEAGNRYGWCTEAYIENETLGMNAPGMPNLATSLIDTFAANVGYFDSVIWAKFYGAIYSLCYFDDDIAGILEEASKVLPRYSRPYEIYQEAKAYHAKHPDDFQGAAVHMASLRIPLYRIDNIQTDPNVNGGMAVISWLYGNGDYLDSCMYSSICGYDADCTSAIVTGALGVIHGFKEGNEEYEELNDMIYHDGEGVYYNDRDSGYPPFVSSKEYFTRIKIVDIVKMYQDNFEKLLLDNGGKIEGQEYVIPSTAVYEDRSYLVANHGAEKRTTDDFESFNATLTAKAESENVHAHSGWAYFELSNVKEGKAYHLYDLVKGAYYRVSAYVTTEKDGTGYLYAADEGGLQSASFSNVTSLANKALVFKATSDKMEVGICFDDNASRAEVLTYDDFFLERIDYQELYRQEGSDYTLSNGRYNKTLSCPEGMLGKEVVLAIEYRAYGGSKQNIEVYRNGSLYGGVTMGNTSPDSTRGGAVLYVPYVYERESDTVSLVFDGRVGFKGLFVLEKSQLMFR